jgi:hypothetical protein
MLLISSHSVPRSHEKEGRWCGWAEEKEKTKIREERDCKRLEAKRNQEQRSPITVLKFSCPNEGRANLYQARIN